ncbi:MAG: PTS glucitol/sorbitol transporter subunit IIA [Lactococcus sp.]|uniref:PTS system sorbitol-specific transporter IIA component SrlB n=1 Tax=Pseudolactococcus piscium MKFS47 TaxID=297352 RepID=A0A0D6DUS2_9LACT|nr:PTS glucitol/sorbitol transporter subunit IIA [Lactococcus piscium]MBR6895518.1 PTS glucitol/sorbitol transporter subunit IIA [Lactococcus sp.]CEN27528.1 PTS system sorbitol-specific transporter IIA component SrlB [Lactococcus piscium MKFS47]
MTVFSTQVMAIGPEAAVLKESQMLILFGEEAPAMLAEFCYMIKLDKINGHIQVGQEIIFDETPYFITAVGDVVQSNLSSLGHITIKFDGSRQAELPGTLYVENKALPDLKVSSTIQIV